MQRPPAVTLNVRMCATKRKRPPTEAASTFQAKIAKNVAPNKTRVHASEVANRNESFFMACPPKRHQPAAGVLIQINGKIALG
jgi:hypothetical protein